MLSYLSPLVFTGDGSPMNQLPVTIKQQCMSNWCWASITELVSALFENPSRSQCQIATNVFKPQGLQCCPCPKFNSPLCNKQCDSTHLLENALGQYSGGTTGRVDITAIAGAVSNQRPVGCRIQLSNGMGYHYIAIVGVSDDQQQIRIADPLQPDGDVYDVSFAEFCSGFKEGVWCLRRPKIEPFVGVAPTEN